MPLVEHEAAGSAVLEEEVGVVTAASERDSQELAREGCVDRGGAAGGKGGAVKVRLGVRIGHFAVARYVRRGESSRGRRHLHYMGADTQPASLLHGLPVACRSCPRFSPPFALLSPPSAGGGPSLGRKRRSSSAGVAAMRLGRGRCDVGPDPARPR